MAAFQCKQKLKGLLLVRAHLAAKIEGVLFAAGDGVHQAAAVWHQRDKVFAIAHRLPQHLSASLPLPTTHPTILRKRNADMKIRSAEDEKKRCLACKCTIVQHKYDDPPAREHKYTILHARRQRIKRLETQETAQRGAESK